MKREARVAAGLVLLLLIGFSLGLGTKAGHAEYDNIRITAYQRLNTATAVGANATVQLAKYRALERTNTQTIMVRGLNNSGLGYKVEMLVNIDDTGTVFVKPETGGDLGTYTDTNWHIIAVNVPLCVQFQPQITELQGNNITVDYGVRTQ